MNDLDRRGLDDVLLHYGVKGMKWKKQKRKTPEQIQQAKLKAQELAKMLRKQPEDKRRELIKKLKAENKARGSQQPELGDGTPMTSAERKALINSQKKFIDQRKKAGVDEKNNKRRKRTKAKTKIKKTPVANARKRKAAAQARRKKLETFLSNKSGRGK